MDVEEVEDANETLQSLVDTLTKVKRHQNLPIAAYRYEVLDETLRLNEKAFRPHRQSDHT